jgi:mono/diheme cytochrome c family protein
MHLTRVSKTWLCAAGLIVNLSAAALAGPAKPPASSLVAAGKAVYAKNGCANCHAIGGKGGKSAPDLSAIGKTKTAKWLEDQIKDPKSHNPDAKMPGYEDAIKDKDLKALVAYLQSLKKK